MRIFDDLARTDTDSIQPYEPLSHWLNRSALRQAEEIRVSLEGWFEHYPPEYQAALRGQLLAKNDTQHKGARFELLLHELFRQMGFRVTVNPPAAGGTPDFLVEDPEGTRLYVEACVVRGQSDDEVKREVALGALVACLNEMDSPVYQVLVDEIVPKGTFPMGKVRRHVEGMVRRGVAEPYETNGWYIKFQLAKKPENLWLETFGGGGVMCGSFDDVVPIREEVTSKSHKYNGFDAPYIIAVQGLAQTVTDRTFGEVLFGDEVIRMPVSKSGAAPPDEELRYERTRNGAWIWATGPQWRHVSGVLAVRPGFPLPLGTRYFFNPWARLALENPFPQLDRCELRGETPVLVEGDGLGDILGLPSWMTYI